MSAARGTLSRMKDSRRVQDQKGNLVTDQREAGAVLEVEWWSGNFRT